MMYQIVPGDNGSPPGGQQPEFPYGEQPTSPYGQPPASPYGQPPASPHGQPPASPHGQPPTSPYGQPPADYPPPAGGYQVGGGYGQQPPPWAGGPYQGYGQPGVVAPKNPIVMLIVSWLISGLGSILNGDTQRGIIILVCHWGSWLLAVICFVTIILFPIGFAFCAAAVGLWIWGVIDAYQGAQRFNVAHGFPPNGS